MCMVSVVQCTANQFFSSALQWKSILCVGWLSCVCITRHYLIIIMHNSFYDYVKLFNTLWTLHNITSKDHLPLSALQRPFPVLWSLQNPHCSLHRANGTTTSKVCGLRQLDLPEGASGIKSWNPTLCRKFHCRCSATKEVHRMKRTLADNKTTLDIHRYRVFECVWRTPNLPSDVTAHTACMHACRSNIYTFLSHLQLFHRSFTGISPSSWHF